MRFYSVCGLDEAGRGALAGPLVGAAVVTTPNHLILLKKHKLTIRDSKLLSKKQRDAIYKLIIRLHITFTTHSMEVHFINRFGIQKANRMLFYHLFRKINADTYIVDGRWKRFYKKGSMSLIDADSFVLPVMLAGIVAKVERDKYMKTIGKIETEYDWHNNAGYGTHTHLLALVKHGSTNHHRSLFVKTALTHFLSR